MSRHINKILGGMLLAACTTVCTHAASAAGIGDYSLSRTFDLPAANSASAGNVLFDALPDGRLLLLNGTDVSVETAPKSATFTPLGSVAGLNISFGPSFLAVTPDGTRAAVGSNGLGSVVVFDSSDPSVATTYRAQDYDAAWIDNTQLAIANASATTGVEVLDTSTGDVTPIITDIGGASAGITFDDAGNLYTANGYSYGTGTSETGWIKAFTPAEWGSALNGGDAVGFETAGTPVADLLSAATIGFDNFGNFYVGGADFFGGSGDTDYAALVDAAAIEAALASPSAVPPINGSSPSDVLRKFDSPQSTLDALQPPSWSYNEATGELYLLRYYQNGSVQAYTVPEPTSLAMLGLGAVGLLRRRRRAAAAVVATGGALVAASQVDAQYVYDANDFAVEVVESTGLTGTSLYNDPAAVLGRPALQFNNSFGSTPDFRRVKVVEPAFNTGLDGEKLITTLNANQSVTVRMGRRVFDDPQNPFGIDLNVFGNAFFVASSGGFVSDDTNLNEAGINGGIFAEPVRVSVSPDNVNWYAYATTGDGYYPTNAYVWDRDAAAWTDELLDPTLPVDPSLTPADFTGISAADAIDLYAGSAGGTGYDLAESGFDWIEYVRFDGIDGFSGGEIDAVAAVRAIPEPAMLSVVAFGALLLRRRH